MGANAATFIDATPKAPCPVCGAHKRCWQARDGRTLRCYRQDSWNGQQGRPVQDGNGSAWTFVVGADARPVEVPFVPPQEPADADTCHRVYRGLLEALDLSREHWADLNNRGLLDEDVIRRRYRTLPLMGRPAIVRGLVERFGPDVGAVPGFYQRESARDGALYWTLNAAPGLLIPVRDVHERIVALRVRPDTPGDGGKYRWLSASSRGGAYCPAQVHVPLRPGVPEVVRITEGELKADVATVLDPSALTISIPGVTTWRLVEPVLQALGCQRVRVALDSDWRTNIEVMRARTDIWMTLKAAGYEAKVEDWTGYKGIDDLLRAGKRPGVAA